jgi:hypothetical protein
MYSDPKQWLARGGFRARLTARAVEDEAFRCELIANPQATIERELTRVAGEPVQLPGDLRIEVHQEEPGVFHFVVPAAAMLAREEDNDLLVFWERILRPAP